MKLRRLHPPLSQALSLKEAFVTDHDKNTTKEVSLVVFVIGGRAEDHVSGASKP